MEAVFPKIMNLCTNAKEEGSGMELALIHGIVKNYGGRFRYTSPE